jgi:hypothetical protein
MIDRPYYLQRLRDAIKRSPITALLGPRQCGKTTLARILANEKSGVFYDLESSRDRSRLQNPEMVLGAEKGLVILDEIQELPELFKTLRVIVDRPKNKTKFLILGSASPHLLKNVSETMAGRVEFVELAPFNVAEVGIAHLNKIWLCGGFPRAFLASSTQDSLAWREGFLRTFLERDIPQLGITIPAVTMRRFWTMLAHFHGQIWNASEIGRSLGLSDKTVRTYLDILTGTFMIRQIPPWFENINKRQVKSPKIYFQDSGILHLLMQIDDWQALQHHYRLGALWEGFAIEQVIQITHPGDLYFWKTHGGAEIDLMYFKHGRRYGVEIKYNESPRLTKSITSAIQLLGLDHVWLLYPGQDTYLINDRVTVISLNSLVSNTVSIM